MKRKRFVRYLIVRAMLMCASAFFGPVHAHNVSLTPPQRQSDGSIAVTLSGSSTTPVMLQGSADMRHWQNLQNFSMKGPPVTYTDSQGTKNRLRYFRLRIEDASLPDLATFSNTVFPAGEGLDSIQFAPDGTLGFIFWLGRNLILRERQGSSWSQQTVTGGGNLYQLNSTRTDYKFQPAAVLLYDSESNPHVFKLNGNTAISHFQRSNGAWIESETITNPLANSALNLMVGAAGPNTFHLACVSGGSNPNMTYASNRNGRWTWSVVTANVLTQPGNYLYPSYAPRWFSLAVDSKNGAHIAFRHKFHVSFNGQYPRAHSELAYASNSRGPWSIEIVQSPRDPSGEAGNGAGIAIGPDDQPAIASWYNERADTGSAQWSRLHFHSRAANGTWSSSIVLNRPDGYNAGDGEKGTGFAPQLRFDSEGRANIVFSDHASEHFEESGQSEYAGQIRHARLVGGEWKFQTLYRQTDPKKQQMIYPAFALNGNEIAVTGLDRETVWNMRVYPPVVTSATYRFIALQRPL